MRTALAMGVDKAIHVEVTGKDLETLQPIHVSKILAKLAQEEKIDLVIVGKQVCLGSFVQVQDAWKEFLIKISLFLKNCVCA